MAILAEGNHPPVTIINCLLQHQTAKLGKIYCPTIQRDTDLTIAGANPNAAPWCLRYTCPCINVSNLGIE